MLLTLSQTSVFICIHVFSRGFDDIVTSELHTYSVGTFEILIIQSIFEIKL